MEEKFGSLEEREGVYTKEKNQGRELAWSVKVSEMLFWWGVAKYMVVNRG
jgi:hypothetical protein